MPKMKVEKISKDFIKPSTPTPDHLRSFRLSHLDQLSFPVFIPVILFYSSTSSSTLDDDDHLHHHQLRVSDRLKKSLSKTLTHFYPLAGRNIKDEFSVVDCNDEGIEYFESRVNGNISDFIMKRDELHQLLPYDFQSTLNAIVGNDSHLIVQVNLFDCGGIAICVCISHKIADGITLTTFINTWASITREAIPESTVTPTFDSAILYPPTEGISLSFSGAIVKQITEQFQGGQAEKFVIRRFVFDGTKIATLRARYGEKNMKYFPTRVEAVTALIWKTAMAASSSPKPSVANIFVDMRRRLDPPLSEQSFGNMATVIARVVAPPSINNVTRSSTSTSTSTGLEEVDLVGPIRESIRKINSDSLKVFQGDDGVLKLQEFMKMAIETYEHKLEMYMFTSWCRIPLYEADFGWGKPDWVGIASNPFKNTSLLMDNRTGDGIEAWICLVEEDMARFERDQELLDFVSFID